MSIYRNDDPPEHPEPPEASGLQLDELVEERVRIALPHYKDQLLREFFEEYYQRPENYETFVDDYTFHVDEPRNRETQRDIAEAQLELFDHYANQKG